MRRLPTSPTAAVASVATFCSAFRLVWRRGRGSIGGQRQWAASAAWLRQQGRGVLGCCAFNRICFGVTQAGRW